MMRRRRGVGIVGVAAVAGVAHHAGTKSAQAQANEQTQNQELADLEAQNAALQQQMAATAAAPAPAAAPAAPAVDPTMAQLQNLASLHTAGVLSDEEFAAAKAKLLGI